MTTRQLNRWPVEVLPVVTTRRVPGPARGFEPLPRPFPLGPLVNATTGSVRGFARRYGLHYRTVTRWARQGVTVAQADELAHRAGLFPEQVWPDWYDAA